MIDLLFGTWTRRILFILTCIIAGFLSLTAALAVAVSRSPSSASAALKIPIAGRIAVAVASRQEAAQQKPKTDADEVKTVRDIRPLSASEISDLIESLREQRKTYEERMAKVNAELKRIQLYRDELAAERKKLTELREKLSAQWNEMAKARAALDRRVIELRSIEAANLKRLAAAYEAMKPDKAAPIISKLDEETAAKTLYLMRERSVAKIMEQLDKDTAARLIRRISLLKRIN